jgi:hypothetical protein
MTAAIGPGESVKFERTRKDTLGWPHRLRVQHVRRRRRFSDDARCHGLYAVGRPALFRTIVPMPEWERIAGNPASAACRASRRRDGHLINFDVCLAPPGPFTG